MKSLGAATRLRLASARRRLATFIAQIDALQDASFPHEDGREALQAIKVYFERQRLDLDVPGDPDPELVDRICHRLSERISNHTTVLGFILRSTNVRNAFETHYVLKRLITRIFDAETRLLISSEWAFVPFTYPMSLNLLPNFVFIGSPAQEAGNPLLVSLAGHEIGHSAWRKQSLSKTYGPLISTAVRDQLNSNPHAADILANYQPMKGLDRTRLENRCAEPALEQLEEVYCDLYGLHLFGSSFLYAFDYLLGPGSSKRSPSYPSDAQRIAFLKRAAEDLRVEVEPMIFERWNGAPQSGEEQALFEIVDAAAAAVVPRLKEDLEIYLKGRSVSPPDRQVIEAVRRAFASGRPYPEKAELGEIITAGWEHLFEMSDMDERSQQDAERVLSDIVLKTIEVAEYHDRIINAER